MFEKTKGQFSFKIFAGPQGGKQKLIESMSLGSSIFTMGLIRAHASSIFSTAPTSSKMGRMPNG